MEDVIRKYTVEEDSETSVFIIFINNEGVVKPIKKVIINAAFNRSSGSLSGSAILTSRC
ncbi:hypothetical protein [Paenibacillus sp. FJAT-27812]|uniref:hypothetical protein n=1 Tax=Paenibacillus sp. FJAT-27812 TaxID=1684143 RepID=UPI000AD15368